MGKPRTVKQFVRHLGYQARRASLPLRSAGFSSFGEEELLAILPAIAEQITKEFDERYGGAASYLQICGVTDAQLDNLRTRLVT